MAKHHIGRYAEDAETVNRWSGRTFYYFKGQNGGPGLFLDAPEYFTIDQTGYYRWEYLPPPRGNIGPWTLCGPFRTEARARGVA